MWLLSAQSDIHSSMVLTQSHPPLRLSFHKLTLLSPPLTARTLPLRLQLTRQTTASNLSSVLCQLDELEGSAFAWHVQMRTVLSCEAEAMYDLERGVGDHATSRTQSECPARLQMLSYDWV